MVNYCIMWYIIERHFCPLQAIITAVSSSSAISSGPGDREERKSENDKGIVIGSATGGVVVLGILVIMSIVVWKRRKPG